MGRADKHEEIVVEIACERYGVNSINIEKLGRGYQNMIYEYIIDNSTHILRISRSSTRTFRQIESELNFLEHLSNYGISVSLPQKSIQGRLVEEISHDKIKYYATAFHKAIGEHIKYPDYLTNHKVFYELGSITAKLHNASKHFPKALNNRVEWTDNYYLKSYEKFIPEEETHKIVSFREQINEINKLSKNQVNFGLIHGDINVGNFFINQRDITLFDFDECQNSWFVEDIAIQLFYTVYAFCDDSIEDRNEKAIEFMQNFLKGYKSEAEIDVEQIKQIPKFLILREMIVHVGIYKKWDLSSLNGWRYDYFRDSSERIKNRKPIVDYNPKWNEFN